MKVCVFSDSHGYAGNMIAAVEHEKPGAVIFLGDGERDLAELESHFPGLDIYSVKGNCDFRSQQSTSICCTIEGVKIYATHGHLAYVKYESRLESLTSQALNAGAQIALFGHTHRQHLSENCGVTLLNPGSAGSGYDSRYAVLTIENGTFQTQLMRIRRS